MTKNNEALELALPRLNGVNPFSDEYYLQELGKLKFKDIEKGDIKVTHSKLDFGIHQNYLYQDMYEQEEEFPVLRIKGTLFMSLSRMEIESHFMPIHLANGIVGVGGLGLGYYVKSILDKDSVKSVTVYETNKDVIDYYYSNFGKHEKLTIVNRSVFDVKKMVFDFFYMDIYETACDTQALLDMKVMKENNYIQTYHFWTIEAFVQAMINYVNPVDLMTSNLSYLIKAYLPFLVVLDNYAVKPTNYLDGNDIFITLTK